MAEEKRDGPVAVAERRPLGMSLFQQMGVQPPGVRG